MNNCTVCDDRFRNEKPNKVICDGICRQVFHAECVNFNKDALMYYREMPNLQWFCDSCVNRAHSFNVSSPLFNKFNSTVVVPTSSPSYVQRSFPAANRNRKPKAKPTKGSVSLVTKSPNVNRSPNAKLVIRNENDSMKPAVKETQPEKLKVKLPDAHGHGSNQLITPEKNRSDVDQPKHQNDSADVKETLKVPPDLENPTANSSSFAEVLTKSSIAKPMPTEVKDSTIQPQNDSIQSQRTLSPATETQKVAYLSKFHPSTTEKEVVDYLLWKNVITSAEDVTCKILVSPYENLNLISFVSFKVTVNSKIFDSVVDSELWPEGVIAREFVKR